MMNFSKLNSALKIFLTTYILTTSIGFFIGLAFVKKSSDITPKKISEHYRGTESENDSAEELKFEKSAKELLLTTHNHILGLSSIFFITSFLFFFTTSVSSKLKLFLMLEPFFSLLLTFGGIWVVRFLWEPFVYLVIFSGVMMFISYGVMNLLLVYELWFKKSNAAVSIYE